MKKILVVVPSFAHGGTNRLLLNMLKTNEDRAYEIEVLAMNVSGVYKSRIEKLVPLVKCNMLNGVEMSVNKIFSDGFFCGVQRFFWKIFFKFFFRSNRTKIYQFIGKRLRTEKYDTIVGFQEGSVTKLVSCIPKKRLIAWVQCDYSSYLHFAGKEDESSIYERFDRIVCVAKYTASVFSDHYPSLADRVIPIYNVIDNEGILNGAKEPLNDERFVTDSFVLTSVGRMDAVKRFSYIPAMARRMVDAGCDFKWYIIGDGGEELQRVFHEIEKFEVEKYVLCLGAKENPYPYIAAADLLVCPSSTEACPNVINEARVLHVPVVAADFPSACEYVEHGVTGIVSTIEGMADELIRLCLDKNVYQAIRRRNENFTYDNSEIRRELELLFSE